jgi:hypothetical protein
MILDDVMQEIATKLTAIEGIRVFAWPVGSVVPPAAIVTYPEEIVFNSTYQNGSETMTIPVVIAVGKATERTTAQIISTYINSAREVIERGHFTSCSEMTVDRCDFDTHSIGGVEYLVAVLNLSVVG